MSILRPDSSAKTSSATDPSSARLTRPFPLDRTAGLSAHPRARFLILLAASLAAGTLWGACFQREARQLLPWLAFSPLLLLCWGFSSASSGRVFVLGWAHGFATWLVSVPWLLPTLRIYGELDFALALGGLLLVCLYLGSYHGVFVWLAHRVVASSDARQQALGWRLGLGACVPALWVGLEWLRSHLISGFAWNLAGYSFAAVPGALPLSAWIGSYGLSFLVVLANAAVALAAIRRSFRPLGLAVPVVGLLLAGAYSVPGLEGDELGTPGTGRRIRILQPNSALLKDSSDPRVWANYRDLLDRSSCEPGELLLWPESAAWPMVWDRESFFRRDVMEIAARGCSVLLNTSRRQGDRWFNSALLVGQEGETVWYDKTHLVPFGEYVPFSRFLPLQRIARNAGSFSPGDRVELLAWGDERLGASVCFEVTFPEEVAARVRMGATILTTLTNDAWYGATAAPWQHLRSARFRAAENRRPLLRAALTGVSAVIDPYGRIVESLEVGTDGVISREVEGVKTLTWYTRYPLLIPVGCSAWALGCLGLLVSSRWRALRR